jgi:hypothetical protein
MSSGDQSSLSEIQSCLYGMVIIINLHSNQCVPIENLPKAQHTLKFSSLVSSHNHKMEK